MPARPGIRLLHNGSTAASGAAPILPSPPPLVRECRCVHWRSFNGTQISSKLVPFWRLQIAANARTGFSLPPQSHLFDSKAALSLQHPEVRQPPSAPLIFQPVLSRTTTIVPFSTASISGSVKNSGPPLPPRRRCPPVAASRNRPVRNSKGRLHTLQVDHPFDFVAHLPDITRPMRELLEASRYLPRWSRLQRISFPITTRSTKCFARRGMSSWRCRSDAT